jgi:lipoprotein NlpD
VRNRTAVPTIALLAVVAAACSHHTAARHGTVPPNAASSPATYHEVVAGETLYRIGKAYGVSVTRLAAANHLSKASTLEVGQRLLIPGADRTVPADVVVPRARDLRAPRGGEAKGKAVFAWPVAGPVTSLFGQRGHAFHDGIDISAPVGTLVHAAQDGEVIYADVLRGYGNMIILRHIRGFATVYAHNQVNRVREGQRVRRGDVIGCVGETGRTRGANLHFEVRQDNVARNPLYFLPPNAQAASSHPAEPGVGG